MWWLTGEEVWADQAGGQDRGPGHPFELPLHGASDEGGAFAQAVKGELAFLVHPVPSPALADDALIVTEVEAVNGELGKLSELLRHPVGQARLQVGEADLEPVVLHFKGVEYSGVSLAAVDPVRRVPVVAPFVGEGAVGGDADEVVHGAYGFVHRGVRAQV